MNIDRKVYIDELRNMCILLRQERELLGMSLSDVAEKIGVSATTIGKIEKGHWNVSVGYLIALAKFYGKEWSLYQQPYLQPAEDI